MKKGNTFLGGCYKGNQYIGELYKGSQHVNSFGFPKTVSGASPITLPTARAKALSKNEVKGNTVRTITIDGVEYVVPSDITLLKYIQLTGTEWINTGIVPSNKKIGAVVDFQFTDTSRTTGAVFGSNKTDGSDNCQFTVYNSKWRIKLNSYATYGDNYDTNRHIARCNMPDGTSLDGTVYTSTQYTIASGNTKDVFVGACNYGTGSVETYSLVGKLYSAKVYDDTTLVRNFIPAKNSQNVVGMYDFVTGTLFTNAGTGTLTAGAELPTPECPLGVKGVGEKYINVGGEHYPVPEGITLLEYINISNGKIDTGIQANPAYTNTKMHVCLTNTIGTTAFFGARGSTSASTRSYNVFGAVTSSGGRFDNVIPSVSYGFAANTWYDIELGHNGLKGTATVNGTLVSTGTLNMENSNVGNIYIGAMNNNGTLFEGSTPSKWGVVEIRKDGTNLSGLFYPAKNSSNVIGMYDFVTSTLIAAEGTVSAGPEATLEYKVTELLASNCGMVDMGTLNWNPIGNGCLYAAITGKANGRNIYCSKYPTDQSSMASATANMHIGGHDGNRVYFKNTSLENTRAAAQADLSGVYLYYQRTTDDTWTEPTTYTAYIDKPLGKVGTYADTFDFASGVHTENTEIIVMDGVTTGHKVNSIYDYFVSSRHYYAFGSIKSSTAYKDFVGFKSNYFKTSSSMSWISANANEIVAQGSQASAEVFLTIADDDTDRNTIEKLNAWFAARLAAGNPVWIGVPLATPTTTQHTAVPVTLAKGTNYLESTNEIKGDLEATYKSREA